MKNNKVFDLGISKIVYCSLCNFSYNALNVNDVKFHDRIHNRSNLAGRLITENIHKHKDIFYYTKNSSKRYRDVWIKLALKNNSVVIHEESEDVTDEQQMRKYYLTSWFRRNAKNFRR